MCLNLKLKNNSASCSPQITSHRSLAHSHVNPVSVLLGFAFGQKLELLVPPNFKSLLCRDFRYKPITNKYYLIILSHFLLIVSPKERYDSVPIWILCYLTTYNLKKELVYFCNEGNLKKEQVHVSLMPKGKIKRYFV